MSIIKSPWASNTKSSRTIRIDEETYSRLAELTGYWSAIIGDSNSMTEMTASIIEEHYEEWKPKLQNVIMNPEKLRIVRAKWKENQAYMQDVMSNIRVKE